jgi:hypothetical protein
MEPSAAGTVFYVEAVRRFEKVSGKDCPRYSAVRAWLTGRESNPDKAIQVAVTLTDCDFKEATFTVPMGALELNNEIFAIVQTNGWESQSYGVLRIQSSGVTTLVDSDFR